MDHAVSAALVQPIRTPVVAAVVGVAVWFIQSRIETLRRAEEALRDERRRAYADVLDPCTRLFAGLKGEKDTQKAMQLVASYDYKRAAFEFAFIGSDDVVRAFNNLMRRVYRAGVESSSLAPRELLLLWGTLLLEIRRSLGDSKTTLEPVDMLRSQIRDIDSLV
jgi:hypothetical protein